MDADALAGAVSTRTRSAAPRRSSDLCRFAAGWRSLLARNGQGQPGVGHRPTRPWPELGPRHDRLTPVVDSRAGDTPDAADPGEPEDPTGGGREGAARRFDLRRAKERPPSSRSIIASGSSVAMVRLPILASRRGISPSWSSASRIFNEASPAARKVSRQVLNSAAVTLASREASSIGSPFNSRSTAPCFRFADSPVHRLVRHPHLLAPRDQAECGVSTNPRPGEAVCHRVASHEWGESEARVGLRAHDYARF